MNPANYERADGLIDFEDLKNLKTAAQNIIKTLKEDGYDNEDAVDYLEQKMHEAGQ